MSQIPLDQPQPAATTATPSALPPAAPSAGPPVVAVVPPPLSASGERDWATAAHLSGFVAAYVALGFLGPLVVRLAVGQRSAFVHRHATEALNFNLSVLLWIVISVPLCLLLIGIPMLIGVGITYLIASIMGAVAAQRGEEFRYPITLRFFH
ncbi:MAG: DUF4870 domain-containing protein [Kineosporiaceae bacterium]